MTQFGYVSPSGNGYAFTADKALHHKRLDLQAGIAYVDYNYSVTADSPLAAYFGFALNGDSLGEDRRFFVRPTLKVTPYISLFGFYARTFDYVPAGILWNKKALNGGMTVDFKELLPKAWR